MKAATLRTLTTEERDHFDIEGYHIACGMLDASEVLTIRDTFMRQAQGGPVPGLSEIREDMPADDPLTRFPRMMHPHRHDELPVGPLAKRYLLDRRIEDVLWDLWDEEPIAAQSMFYFKPPGSRGQDLHQDNFYLGIKPGTCMAAWIAIDRAEGENGGLRVVPGSHRMDVVCPEASDLSVSFTNHHVAVPEGAEAVQLELDPGDCLFFNGSVIHGSRPNTTTDRFRRSLIMHYAPASCHMTARHYRPLFNFRGEVVRREENTQGGPCGELMPAKSPH